MVTVFETSWMTAGRAAFLTAFGQPVTFQPGTLNRVITAIVRYVEDDAAVSPIVRHRSPQVKIKVANDAVLGIAASEFGDNQTISVPPRPGAAARVMQLARIVKANGVWVTYECH
jgi:hypothetical protein